MYLGNDVIPSNLKIREDDPSYDGLAFDNIRLRVGEVQKIVYPNDAANISKKFIEYNVFVSHYENGTFVNIIYNNCTLMNLFGGLADKVEYTLRESDSATKRNFSLGLGSKVIILCINGKRSNPVIIGGIRDQQDTSESKLTKDNNQGHHFHSVFNGIDFLINKDGELTVTYKGKTNNNGTTNVPDTQSGSFIKMSKEGNITISDKDINNQIIIDNQNNKVRLTSNSALMEIDENGSILAYSSDGSMIFMDARIGSNGIKLVDSNGNNVVIDSDGISIVDSAGASIALTANGTIQTASDDMVIASQSIGLSAGSVSVGQDADSSIVRGDQLVQALIQFATGLTVSTLTAKAAALIVALSIPAPAPTAVLSGSHKVK